MSMIPQTVTEMQRVRQVRAATEKMHFRLGTLLGFPVVYVASKTSIYTVPGTPQVPGRCNCRDSQDRLKGTAARCKHEQAAWAWLEKTGLPVLSELSDSPAEVAAQVDQTSEVSAVLVESERRARIQRNLANDFCVED